MTKPSNYLSIAILMIIIGTFTLMYQGKLNVNIEYKDIKVELISK